VTRSGLLDLDLMVKIETERERLTEIRVPSRNCRRGMQVANDGGDLVASSRL
jgi:hypothetical protein